MKKIVFLMNVMTGVLALTACSDDAVAPSGGGTVAVGEVNFTLSQEPATRAHYASQDWLQMEWDVNDVVTIACAQTQAPVTVTDPSDPDFYAADNWQTKTSAEYKVTSVLPYTYDVSLSDGGKTTVTTNSLAKIGPSSNDPKEELYWVDDANGKPSQHTFYAAAGAGVTINASSGKAKFPYLSEQLLELVNGTWINTKYAYMVASKTTSRVDDVALAFRPIMTTLEIEVLGASAGDIDVKALEVTIPASQDVIYIDSKSSQVYFDYDIKGDKSVLSSSRADETIIFTLPTPQKVAPTGSIKITAVLPPVAIDSSNPITIVVDTKEGSSRAKYAKTVDAKSKVVIKSDNWKAFRPTFQAVDLGLSVKWATFNLGASKPEEYGDYYGWAQTVPYATSVNMSGWEMYWQKLGSTATSGADCGGTLDPLLKYIKPAKVNMTGSEWDVAHVKLGGAWRLPTEKEADELKNNCDWEWQSDYNGTKVKGYLVKSRTNGNSIFLPAAGLHDGVTRKLYSGNNAYYWTSFPGQSNIKAANVLFFYYENDGTRPIARGGFERRNGFSVRPVCD
ncbi:MAG: hypothetical protein HUK02_09575 [Bacteroidaceae bacterium]|nr:hypothetical protein [Bacteroidaceae bacterium]